MSDGNALPPPPGATPLRVLLRNILDALVIPPPADERAELAYLRIKRSRARLVAQACRRILDDPEAGDEDLLAAAAALRAATADYPPAYPHHPMSQ